MENTHACTHTHTHTHMYIRRDGGGEARVCAYHRRACTYQARHERKPHTQEEQSWDAIASISSCEVVRAKTDMLLSADVVVEAVHLRTIRSACVCEEVLPPK